MRLELLSTVLALPAVSFAQKKIVLSNDDGWATANIRALYQALTEEGHNVRPNPLIGVEVNDGSRRVKLIPSLISIIYLYRSCSQRRL